MSFSSCKLSCVPPRNISWRRHCHDAYGYNDCICPSYCEVCTRVLAEGGFLPFHRRLPQVRINLVWQPRQFQDANNRRVCRRRRTCFSHRSHNHYCRLSMEEKTTQAGAAETIFTKKRIPRYFCTLDWSVNRNLTVCTSNHHHKILTDLNDFVLLALGVNSARCISHYVVLHVYYGRRPCV